MRARIPYIIYSSVFSEFSEISEFSESSELSIVYLSLLNTKMLITVCKNFPSKINSFGCKYTSNLLF